jgi:large subunit ribosomal protein L4
MLKGGGVAFGPKPRSFKTGLPGKIYDLAWRTALSYRYRMGELIVLGEEAEIPESIYWGSRGRWMRDLLRWNRMGHPDGRTLFVTSNIRERLFETLEEEGREARALEVGDVDVKDLLELGRVCVEKSALDEILRDRESDLTADMKLRAWEKRMRQVS